MKKRHFFKNLLKVNFDVKEGLNQLKEVFILIEKIQSIRKKLTFFMFRVRGPKRDY